ncbi:hypothetical protein K432DRAFT_93776 [Lepidopterella palustris CBS 459.81]|uniref:Secreted protein n=1 Tax=Lepidopterella palustris CBS 459.81 TaxID=1314670 RepID=A0A8E2JDF0_9PEZI|nr:hypothetical protein K432DRAFT_93776 [Lepidopterella palustris CBS 459.81]
MPLKLCLLLTLSILLSACQSPCDRPCCCGRRLCPRCLSHKRFRYSRGGRAGESDFVAPSGLGLHFDAAVTVDFVVFEGFSDGVGRLAFASEVGGEAFLWDKH